MGLKNERVLIAAAGLLALGTASASAAGFYLEERSVKASGRAFAGAAAMADDASVMSYNPAALTGLPRASAAAGGYLIMPKAALADRGSSAAIGPFTGIPVGGRSSDQGFSPQPSGYLAVAAPLTQDLWLGLALTAPFGLKDEYKSDYFGRYDSTKSEVMVLDIAPTIAYRVVPGVSLGASLNVQRATTTLISAIPNPFDPAVPNPASDGTFDVRGKDWRVGFTVGLLFEPRADLRLGVNYRAAVTHRLSGDATTTFLGAATKQGAAADLKLPDVISVAVAYDLTPAVTLLAQANRYGWKRFEEIRLEFADDTALASPENFRSTWGFAAGAEVRASERWSFRGGIEFDQTPTVDRTRSTRIPDANRLWAAVGASYHLSDRFSVDFSYSHMFKKTKAINRTTAFPLFAASIDTIATTDTSSNVIGLGLSSGF